MREEKFDGHLDRPVVIDLCHPCQSFWFDAHESLSLTPGSTLALFRIIGEHTTRCQPPVADTATCPRCRARLRRTHDMQRMTRFEYLKCPHGHGRLTTFLDFLREKDFIRPLTAHQIAELRQTVESVNCSNCGASVDLTRDARCGHCGSPLSMLDMKQTQALIAQLAARPDGAVHPALPLGLARVRRDVDLAFDGFERDEIWFRDASATGLVGAGLSAVARWLKRHA